MRNFGTVFRVVLGAALLVVSIGAAAAGPEVKRGQLEWQDIAHDDGAVMYDNLCAACHGAGGRGNGPAAAELEKSVPDLGLLAANHGGAYPHDYVVNTLYGESRSAVHGKLDMPDLGKQFMYVGRGWHSFPRRQLADNRIHTLADYVETLQAN